MNSHLKVNVIGGLCLTALITVGHAPDSPVADAAMRGEHAALLQLLEQGADVNAAQGDGMTALHWASERDEPQVVDVLLLAGANTEAVTRIGQYTPLHLASKSGSASIVEKMLAVGSDVHAITSNTGVTPLHLAAASGSPETVAVLLQHGADPNARESEWDQTPLIFAAASNRAGAIRVLLEQGGDPEITSKVLDYDTLDVLSYKAQKHETDVLEALTGGSGKPTPKQLQIAVRAGREIYLDGEISEEDIEEKNSNESGFKNPYLPLVHRIGGFTPLLHAARQGHIEATHALLDGGANIDGGSASDGTSPLLIAALNGQFDLAIALVDRGANPNIASDLNGATPLWGVLNSKWQPRTRFPQPQEREQQEVSHLDLMVALLKAGANPNARITKQPWYMMHTGCGSLNCGMVNTSGSTAFFRAAYGTDVEAMRVLMEYGANPNVPTSAPPKIERVTLDGYMETSIKLEARDQIRRDDFAELPDSVRLEKLVIVRRELSAAAQITFSDEALGQSPNSIRFELLAAVEKADSIRAAAPDPSGLPTIPPGGAGVWPIHAASGAGYGEGFAGNAHRHAPDGWIPAVKYLVEELDADVNTRDFNGYTPLHHAAARGDNELILYLVEMGADVTTVSRYGETTADMANGPVQRLAPIPETIALLESLGSKNNHNCFSC